MVYIYSATVEKHVLSILVYFSVTLNVQSLKLYPAAVLFLIPHSLIDYLNNGPGDFFYLI